MNYYGNSRVLHNLALAATRKDHGKLTTASDYRKAINFLVCGWKERKGFLQRVTLGAERKVLELVLQQPNGKTLPGILDQWYQKAIVPRIPLIEQVWQDEQTAEVKNDVGYVLAGITKRNPYVLTALYSEIAEQWIADIGINQEREKLTDRRRYRALQLARYIAEIIIPGLATKDIKLITPEYLQTIIDLGLIECCGPAYLLNSSGVWARAIGQNYLDKAAGWRAIPHQQEVSTVDYQERVRNWQRLQRSHEAFSGEIGRRLAQFKASSGLESSGKINQEWLQKPDSVACLSRLNHSVFDDPRTIVILDFPVSATVFRTFSTTSIGQKEVGELKTTIGALRTILDFLGNQPELYPEILSPVAYWTYSISKGLYSLKEHGE